MSDDLLAGGTEINPPIIDDSKDYLQELVGDGKKFKTSEDLAKGKFHADQTIEVLKRENEELRQEYKRARDENVTKAKLEDLLDRMTNQKLDGNINPPADTQVNQPIKPEDIENLISEKIVQMESNRKEKGNYDVVQKKLQERYGTNYVNVLKQQIDELGLTSQEATALAKRSPQAFFKTFGLNEETRSETYQAPPRSMLRNDTFAPTPPKKRTWSYYQDLKKKDKDFIYNTTLQVQMLKDAVELGEEFRDGDYYRKGLHERI